ncbi:hypothetical protein H0H81_004554 [Sphagnurus paluster]|uniref:F-box domain-containing protein n=1 Tax=Sphagnurus paluster TaxID=117069 RepID=A0A9P7FUF1_9AGAR|nr:hypothetical protein H0H81_004554 [Sphagnurus paluster]
MPNSPSHTSNTSLYLKPTKFNQNKSKQHGAPDNRILLDVPSETLTGITSYLDPPSLIALAQVHRRLNWHVKDDITWRRAFLCQILNIGPEGDIHNDTKSLMLRRSEKTWRNEFIVRHEMRRRWEKSRNATVSHIPLRTEISSMHLMPGPSLLASSLQLSVISRTIPLTGKVLPGYLTARDDNVEFLQETSACALFSDGGTAKALWGYRHGEVAVMTVPRAMDASRRPATNMARGNVRDGHEGAVLDTTWDSASGTFGLTAGADGRVKVWDTKTVRCLWVSEPLAKLGAPDACLKIAVSSGRGWVATVSSSGEVVLWTGFIFQSVDAFSASSVKVTRVRCPEVPTQETTSNASAPVVTSLYIDDHSPDPTVLVAYEDSPFFYRIRIDTTGQIEITPFGDASFGFISVISPFFAPDSSFVLAGDHLGCVSVYDWVAPTPTSSKSGVPSVQCVQKFEAHSDGASVTALAWNSVTLITGSSRGTSRVWDALSFEHLRTFMPHGNERQPVRQILTGTDKQIVLISTGDRVLAWQAGKVPRSGSGGVRGRNTSGTVMKKNKGPQVAAKYHHALETEKVELRETIAESTKMIKKENEQVKQGNMRTKQQIARLESLGLDEAGAVDYLLMLSREEALQRSYQEQGHHTQSFIGLGSSSTSPPSNSGTLTPKTSSAYYSTEITRASDPEPPSPLSPDVAPFPEISPPSSSKNSPPASPAVRKSNSVSSDKSASAWNVPLQVRYSPTATASSIRPAASDDEIDEELRFALELSLAEAISRGEDV